MRAQAAGGRFLREQPGREQNAGVGGVGARGDGGNQHIAVADIDLRVVGGAAGFQVVCFFAEAALIDRAREKIGESAFERRQRDAILRAFGAGDRGLDAVEIEFDDARIIALPDARDSEKLLRAQIIGEGLNGFFVAAGGAQIIERFVVDGENPIVAPYSGAILAMVARSGTSSAAAPSPKNSTNWPTTLAFRKISVTVRTRSVAVTPGRNLPSIRMPTTSGVRIKTGWPSIAASASMPPTPQPTTPAPLIIVVCESAPTSESGYKTPSREENAAGEVFEIDLVDDADSGRDDAQAAESARAPFEELIALAVALEFDFHIEFGGVGAAGEIDLNGMVDDEVDGRDGLDGFGIFAGFGGGVAHGGEVGEEGDSVKSCKTTRATEKGISDSRFSSGRQLASFLACSGRVGESGFSRQLRTTDSRTIRSETGKRETSAIPASASAGKE